MYANFKDQLWIFNSIKSRKTQTKMAHVSHVTNCMVDPFTMQYGFTSSYSLTSCFNSLQILSVDNEIQFHQLHHLNDSYHLKGPPSSRLYRTVSKSNDMQFHHLHDLNESYQLKGPPSLQLYRTIRVIICNFTTWTTWMSRTSWKDPLPHSSTEL